MFAVDGEDTFAIRIQLGSNFTNAEVGFGFVGNLAVIFKRHVQLVEFRLAHLCRPPQPRTIKIKL